MAELFYILAGWVLGLLSPIIADSVRDWQRRKHFLKSARVELDDLRFTLAFNAFLLKQGRKRLTVDLVALVARIVDNYKGNEPVDTVRQALTSLRSLSQESLDQIQSKLPVDGKGHSLKLMEPKFIITNIDDLSSLKEGLQLRFFELIRTISSVNQEIPKIDQRVWMTFDSSLSKENYDSMLKNIENDYNFIADQCISAIRKIEFILEDPAVKHNSSRPG